MPKCKHPNVKLEFVIEYWLDSQAGTTGVQISRDAIASVKVGATCPDCGFTGRFNAYSEAFVAAHGYGADTWQHSPRWLRAQLGQVAALSPFIATTLRVCGFTDNALAG